MTSRSNELVGDGRIDRAGSLATPAQLHHESPLGDQLSRAVIDARRAVTQILCGQDDRLMVIVGPCSVHDPKSALEYAIRLRETADRLADDLLVVMRVYLEKPRSAVGWKGLINDPGLDGSDDVNTGLRTARSLLLDILARGLPVACEFLDPITAPYIADTVAWGAIGARTVESQIHRQLASGLPMPVGMKNRTDGDLGAAVDAIRAAGVPHTILGSDEFGAPTILRTKGNADCHLVLRGGQGHPNHHPADVADALTLLRRNGLPERLVIDVSHGNSGKDHTRQPLVISEVASQLEAGQRGIVGAMLESFLVEGRQDLDPTRPLRYGQSITDACLGWPQTVTGLERLAVAVATRRVSVAANRAFLDQPRTTPEAHQAISNVVTVRGK